MIPLVELKENLAMNNIRIPQILLLGGGGHCRACIDVIEQTKQFQIFGIVDSTKKMGETLLGYPIVGSDENLPELRKHVSYALITVGQIQSSNVRVLLYQNLQALKFILPVIISPRAYVSRYAKIGAGTIIMHDGIVNADASIGINCIINSKALIEHEAIIEDHCHIATGAIVNGKSYVYQKHLLAVMQ